MRHSMTFDECVYSYHWECSAEYAFRVGSVPYFCGQAEVCIKPSKEAVQLAKRNVNKYYGVVALTEDIMNGVALLEQTTPKLFRGLTSVAASMINITNSNATKTFHRQQQNAMEMMDQRLALDNELYSFIKQRYEVFKDIFGQNNTQAKLWPS